MLFCVIRLFGSPLNIIKRLVVRIMNALLLRIVLAISQIPYVKLYVQNITTKIIALEILLIFFVSGGDYFLDLSPG